MTQAELILLQREVERRLAEVAESTPNPGEDINPNQNPFNRPSAVSQERERFLGKWSVQKAVMNGIPVEEKLLAKAFVEFTGEEMTFALTPDAVGKENKFPYELDLTLVPHGINTHHKQDEGENTLILGIYQFQEDVLHIAFASSIGDPRPEGFAPLKGNENQQVKAAKWVTLVLTRDPEKTTD